MEKEDYFYLETKANEIIRLLEMCDDDNFINLVIEAISSNGIVDADEYICENKPELLEDYEVLDEEC